MKKKLKQKSKSSSTNKSITSSKKVKIVGKVVERNGKRYYLNLKTNKEEYELSTNEEINSDGSVGYWRQYLRDYKYTDAAITEYYNKKATDGAMRRIQIDADRKADAERVERRRIADQTRFAELKDKGEVRQKAGKILIELKLDNKTEVPVKATEAEAGGKRYFIHGHNVTSVLRWMREADAWTFDDARKAMAKLGLPVADATLNAQLRAGVIGTRGEPAKLTERQIEELYSLIEDEPCPPKKKVSANTSRTVPTAKSGGQGTSTKKGLTKGSSSRPAKNVGNHSSSKSKKLKKKAR